MSARSETFKILKNMVPGTRFTGYDLMLQIKAKTGEIHYPSTYLRYVRIFRQQTGTKIVNINNKKSLYEVKG